MAKLGGTKRTLQDFTLPYSLEVGGKVYNLSTKLIAQQSTSMGLTDTFVGGGSLTGTGPLDKQAAFSLPPLTPPTYGLKTLGSMRLDFPAENKSVIGDTLSFTTQEFTVSMWVYGPTYASVLSQLQTKYILQSSGSQGVQFSLGRWDQTASGRAYHFAVAALTSSGADPVIVATSTRTAGKTSAEIGGTGPGTSYRGRYYQLTQPPIGSAANPKDNLDPSWVHVAYVQRAASNPTVTKYDPGLGTSVSPFDHVSRVGDEGRCELWVDGELVYNTPAYGPFPQGHSPFFVEDGLSGLLGSNFARGYAPFPAGIRCRTLRQNSAMPFISGSTGDAIAQFAIWNRCLGGDEIASIYQGQINGVYTDPVTSFSSAPKRLLDVDNTRGIPLTNSGFNDFLPPQALGPFSDGELNETLVAQGIYQGNNYLNLPMSSITKATIGDGSIQSNREKVAAFIDVEEVSAPVYDPELVIPSGSASIRIKIPNLDPNSVAARAYNPQGAVDTLFYQQVGNESTSNFIGTGFLYYSPFYKKWVEKRASSETSLTPDQNLTTAPYSATNFVKQAKQSEQYTVGMGYGDPFLLSSRIMGQFAWSPQFGYYVNHVEHLRQAGYERIGWPTSMFNAPNAPKYHGYDQETFKMRDYIDRPFVLKRIEVRVPVKSERVFGANPKYGSAPYGDAPNNWDNQITNKKDLDNYVFFVYRQRRVSRERDGFEDRNTSKRYLIASASVCYYNLGSFGGAWNDGFISSSDSAVNPHQTKWTAAGAVYTNLAHPTSASDYYGVSLTSINADNCILHTPQLSINWNQNRFIGSTDGKGNYAVTGSDSRFLNLTMLPHVVPACSVAPSLIPVTASFQYDDTPTGGVGTPTSFQLREGGVAALAGKSLYCGMYVTTGSRGNVNRNTTAAPYLTLASNYWFGGTRPPLFFAGTAVGSFGSLEADPYDSFPPVPANLAIIPGSVDAMLTYSPAWNTDAAVTSTNYGWQASRFSLNRSPVQTHGISITPSALRINSRAAGTLTDENFVYQIPIDPQSVNSVVPTSDEKAPAFLGRKTQSDSAPNAYTVETKNTYMGLYGWRFISSFQKSDYTAKQTYSPTILDPDDELILGLDAGTFGPPDLDSSTQSIYDGVLNATPENISDLNESAIGSNSKRFHKLTYLKEDYRLTLPHSRLKILTGDAELILIGEYLKDETAEIPQRSTPVAGSISSYYGNSPVSDVNFLYSTDLLSGSLFTRVYTGSEGPVGLINGNNDPALARRFYLDLGARRTG